MIANDKHWMQHALSLAERGKGDVEPNPMVGAVIVKDDQLISEGWHHKYGEAHAEVDALSKVNNDAHDATIYVTLEPCCHQGKTPPCTEAVIQAKPKRVVIAMRDPFPQVSGQGIAQLQAAGIEVDVGICKDEAHQLNAPYLKLVQAGRPYVHLKWAMTLDGKISTRTGDSQWISNEQSRRQVHELRGRVDAILVGIGTALADDPQLTARPPGPRIATRIVLDSQGRIPLDSQLVQTACEIPTIIVTTSDAPKEKLEQHGCEVLVMSSLTDLLDELGRRRMTNILVEGGAKVLGSFIDQQLADALHIYIGPKLFGGRDAPSPIAGEGVTKVIESPAIQIKKIEQFENDVMIHAVFDFS